MERRICPSCGTPQQFEMWQHCLCGHDFGQPPLRESVLASEVSPEVQGSAEECHSKADLKAEPSGVGRFFSAVLAAVLVLCLFASEFSEELLAFLIYESGGDWQLVENGGPLLSLMSTICIIVICICVSRICPRNGGKSTRRAGIRDDES